MKKTNNIKLKNNCILLVILIFMLSLMLVGCSSEATTETVKSKPEAVEKEEETTTVQVEVNEEKQKTEVEEIVEPTESLEEWLNGIEEEVCMAVWNESIGKKDIIQNGQTYELQDGDRLFIHTPSMMITCDSPIVTYNFLLDRPYDNYTEIIAFDSEYEGENPMLLDIGCKGGEQCHFECVLIGDGSLGEGKAAEETTVEEGPVLSISDGWEKELNYEDPKILVWNERIGLKQEIANNETYQLQVGDYIVLYEPKNYDANDIQPKEYSLILFDSFKVISFYSKEVTEETKFVINFREQETFEEVKCEFTLLPIQK